MGKTASGAIWLDAKKTSSYDFWQFWRNTLDDDVGKFLKLFTELEVEECERLGALEGEEINEAKIILANAVCTLCHKEEATKKAEATAKEVFEKGGVGSELEEIHITDFTDLILAEQPMGDGYHFDYHLNVIGLLVQAKLAGSNREAKRHIASGAVRISNQAITTTFHSVLMQETVRIKISIGKKRHAIVVLGPLPTKN